MQLATSINSPSTAQAPAPAVATSVDPPPPPVIAPPPPVISAAPPAAGRTCISHPTPPSRSFSFSSVAPVWHSPSCLCFHVPASVSTFIFFEASCYYIPPMVLVPMRPLRLTSSPWLVSCDLSNHILTSPSKSAARRSRRGCASSCWYILCEGIVVRSWVRALDCFLAHAG